MNIETVPGTTVMDSQKRFKLSHLKDMFNEVFTEDLIESVLEQRQWDMDRALDDLMILADGNEFSIPVEDFNGEHFEEITTSNQSEPVVNVVDPPIPLFEETKNESEEDIIVLEEEEYCLPAESESDEEIPEESPKKETSTISYASAAKKPAAPVQHFVPVVKPLPILYSGFTSFDRIKRTRDSIERVKLFVGAGFKIMVILRGCPGSGKSTLAKSLLGDCGLDKNPYWYVHSTDNYFHLNESGTYQHDREKLSEAHNWNKVNVLKVVREGLTPIIVDNTNTKMWEMQAYASMAVCAGYEIEIIEPDTPWAFSVKQLKRMNVHSIGKENIQIMLDRYEHNITPTHLIRNYKLQYAADSTPPQIGIKELKNPELLVLFDDLYKTIHFFPQELQKLKKKQPKKKNKKENRKLRRQQEREMERLAKEIENCVEIEDLEEAESSDEDRVEVNRLTEAFVKNNLEDATSDSEQYWTDMWDDEESVTESSSSCDDENSSDQGNGDNVFVTKDIPAEAMTFVEETPKESTSKPETDTEKKFKSTQLYDQLAKNGPRLKCFEMFHTDGEISEVNLVETSADVHAENIENADTTDSFDLPTAPKNILNNAVPFVEETPARSTESIFSPLNVLNGSVDKLKEGRTFNFGTCAPVDMIEAEPVEVADSSSQVRIRDELNQLIDSNTENADESDLNTSNSSNLDVTVMYKSENKPKLDNDLKSSKSMKNINIGEERNPKSCNVGLDFSRKNILKEESSVNTEAQDQILSSNKFRDDSTSISNSLRKNVMDLWVENENNRTRCSSENSENSDCGSNSSSSEGEDRIEDVHNIVNRFVNNDIKCEQPTERKKQNVNLLKHRNTADDSAETPPLNVDSSAELNTLKERILASGNDKAFGQTKNSDEFDGENASTSNQKSSTSSFQTILNKLNEKTDVNDTAEGAAAGVEMESSRFWNQWMRGEGWEDTKEHDKKEAKYADSKPPRDGGKHSDSPTKQKNSDTGNIRLVNDIKSMSEKNTNIKTAPKIKTTNCQATSNVNDFFKYRDYASSNDEYTPFFDVKAKNTNLEMYSRKTTNEQNSEETEKAKPGIWEATDLELASSAHWEGHNSPYRRKYEKSDKEWTLPEKKTLKSVEDFDLLLEPKPHRKNMKKTGDKTPEYVDELVNMWKDITRDESATVTEMDKTVKWSPLHDSVAVEWPPEKSQSSKTTNQDIKPQRIVEEARDNFTEDWMKFVLDKGTSTSTDDFAEPIEYRIARCREINENRGSVSASPIEQKIKCSKSTMTENSSYTVKAKPKQEDLLNIFPKELADSIQDLYEKCNGNMDWIIEILLEDGYSPSEAQLEYLSSLQNITVPEIAEDEVALKDKDKFNGSKKKKSNGNGKSMRRDEVEDSYDSLKKKIKRKKTNPKDDGNMRIKIEIGSQGDTSPENEIEEAEEAEEDVELFLDAITVEQLVNYFGNPTVLSLKEYQPVIKLPAVLARQIHAHLLGSIIEQAEKNESLINLLVEEDKIVIEEMNTEAIQMEEISFPPDVPSQEESSSQNNSFSQNDVFEVESSLCDVIDLGQPSTSTAAEDSFASKLSLDLLLKSFPTVDPCFVVSTFRSNNCNYYETKEILSTYRNEVPTSLSFNSNDTKNYLSSHVKGEDYQLFKVSSVSRNDVRFQVDKYRDQAAYNYEQWQKFKEKLNASLQAKKYSVASYYRELMNVFKVKYEESNAKAAAVLINSCCYKNTNFIDLHFFKVSEALQALDMFLDHHITQLLPGKRPKTILYIITGRGASNPDRVSHLQPPIKNRLKRRNVEFKVEPSNTGMVIAIVRKNSLLSHNL